MEAGPERWPALAWHKSHYSGDTANCLEVASTGVFILVRDSQQPGLRTMRVTPAQWSQLLVRLRRGKSREIIS